MPDLIQHPEHIEVTIGVGMASFNATPPSEPDVRISRIRLSGRWLYLTRTGTRYDGPLQGYRAQGPESIYLASVYYPGHG